MNIFKNMNVLWKVMFPVILGFVAIFAVLYLLALPSIEDALFAEKQNFIKNIVRSSVSLIENYEMQYKDNKISKEEAYSKIEELIRATRFDGDNYLFVTDFDVMLYHGVKPALEGKKLDEFKDVNDKLFLLENSKVLKNKKESFVDYYWSRPNIDGQFPKLAFSERTKVFNLIVTAGIYVDDVEKQIATINYQLLSTFSIIIVLLLVALWLIVHYTIVKPMKLIAKISNDVSEGNLEIIESYNSKDELGTVFNSISKMVDTLHELIKETNILTESAIAGKLDFRGRENMFKGSYSELVHGINGTLDAIIAPLNVAAEYIDRISKGDMPPKIIDKYNGDFNEIKNNINQCIDSISLLVSDANSIVKFAIEGKLDNRANEMNHHGDFRKIISGVNSSMDRLVGLIDNMPIPVQIVDKDYKINFINKAGKQVLQ